MDAVRKNKCSEATGGLAEVEDVIYLDISAHED